MRYIKYIVLSVIVAAVLILVGFSTIKQQNAVEVRQSSFTLTDFDFVVLNPSVDTVEEWSKDPSVNKVFGCRTLPGIKVSGVTSAEIIVLMSDMMENSGVGLFNDRTLLSGSYDENGIMLDETAANRLKVKVGDSVRFAIRSQTFTYTVSAIYMASTYKDLENGLALIAWTPQIAEAYAEPAVASLWYQIAFIDVNDEAAFDASLKDYVRYYRSFENYLKDFKMNNPEMPEWCSTVEEWNESIYNAYLEELKDFFSINYYSKDVQKKSNYMADVKDQVASKQATINGRSIAIAIASFVVYMVLSLIFAVTSRKEDLRKFRAGIKKNKLFVTDAIVSAICTASVALATAIALIVQSSKQVAASTNYTGIILFFSLPVLLNLAFYIPFNFLRLKNLYNRYNVKTYNPPASLKKAYDFCGRFSKVALVVLVVTVFVVLVNYFFAGSLTQAYSTRTLIKNSDNTEIVFTRTPTDNQCFVNFNGKTLLLTKDQSSINADLYMVMPGMEYTDNVMGYTGKLSSGTCRISENLMKEYGLKKGDTLSVKNSSEKYKIGEPLVAQQGNDPKYEHNGLIILAANENIVNSFDHSYVSFYKSVDQYNNLERRVILNVRLKNSTRDFGVALLFEILFATVIVVAVELLLGKSFRVHYRRLKVDGVDNKKITLTILKDFAVKYMLPCIVVTLGFYSVYSAYKGVYFVPMLIVWAYQALLIALATVYYYWRIRKWEMKK